MRRGIDVARHELAIWESRVAQDREALAVAEREATAIRERLAASVRVADGLRGAVQRWDAMQASHDPPNL